MKVLKNLMQEAVYALIDELHEQQQFHLCEICRHDIAALALNNLPSRYVVRDKGESYAKADLLELQKYIDVVSAVTRAINTVTKNPRH